MSCTGTINWLEIEPRILPHVKVIRDAGYATTGSCGHDMWITIDLDPSRLTSLHNDLMRLGYRDFEIIYSIHEGFHRWKGARVQFGGAMTGDGKPFDLVLLKVEPDSHPLYFVIKSRAWPGIDTTDSSDDEYFYGEHTCPTNWTDDIVAVISEGDDDPHGFATFVRRRNAPPSMDENGDGSEESWIALFPETGTSSK